MLTEAIVSGALSPGNYRQCPCDRFGYGDGNRFDYVVAFALP